MPARKTQHSFSYNGTQICYELERKRVKNINLRVRPDGSVYVSAPKIASMERIAAFVQSKGAFITRAMERFAARRQQLPAERRYESGETFYLLGKKLCLRVSRSTRNAVAADGDILLLYVKDETDAALKQRLTERFFMQECRQLFPQLVAKLYPLFKDCNFPYPELRIRSMRSRWGSCMPSKKRITLNSRLIHYPQQCIEYVIVHEFCHFRYMNHSKQFYALVASFMPDWKECRNLLR